MKLSDRRCKAAKPTERQYKLTDGESLYLLVKPNGSKLWQMAYTWQGKRRTASFGPYPGVTLAEARERRSQVRKTLRDGFKPTSSNDGDGTFQSVANAYLSKKSESVSARYMQRVRQRLAAHVFPDIGHMQLAEITPPMILATIRKIEARGTYEVSHDAKTYISQVFRYAVGEGLAVRDVTADLRGLLTPKRKTQNNPILQKRDIPDFLKRLDSYDGDEQTRIAILLTMHTMVRTKEIRFALREGEWDLSADIPFWRIPADRMKMSRPHIVPLSPQVIELLKIAQQHDERYLFPGLRPQSPISENTMLYALYRMGYKGQLTIHGLRGTASTVLNESGLFEPDWIERQLAHDDRDKIRGAYNAAQYIKQRYKMMCWWSDYVASQSLISDVCQ